MKKIILGVVLLAAFSLSSGAIASMKYECWTYIDGKPDKMTYVTADNKSEAQSLAEEKFENLGRKWDYIKCH